MRFQGCHSVGRWGMIAATMLVVGTGACSKAPEPAPGESASAKRDVRAARTAQALYEAQAVYDAGGLYAAEDIYAQNEILIDNAESQSLVASVGVGSLFRAIQSKQGSQVIVLFWSPGDPAGAAAAAELTRLAKIVQAANVAYFSIMVRTDIDTQVRPYAKNHYVPERLYVLNEDAPDLHKALPCATSWDGSLPAAFVLDENGELRRELVGSIATHDVLSALGPVQATKTMPIAG